MGDVGESAVAATPIFIVTGFSSFSGVAANPTESLIHYLESSGSESAGAERETCPLLDQQVTCRESAQHSRPYRATQCSMSTTQAMSTLRHAWCWTSTRASSQSGSASCVRGYQRETADKSSGCAFPAGAKSCDLSRVAVHLHAAGQPLNAITACHRGPTSTRNLAGKTKRLSESMQAYDVAELPTDTQVSRCHAAASRCGRAGEPSET